MKNRILLTVIATSALIAVPAFAEDTDSPQAKKKDEIVSQSGNVTVMKSDIPSSPGSMEYTPNDMVKPNPAITDNSRITDGSIETSASFTPPRK